MSYEDFMDHLTNYASNNMPWIEKVGGDSLARSKLTVINFVKAMQNRTLLFDKLCITIACRAFNVHAVILLDLGFWSTRPDNNSSNCLLKLAYVGDFGFKELCVETAMLFDDKSNESEEEEEEGMMDLEDTGLFGSAGSESEGDSKQADANMDVKPDIETLLPFISTFTTTAEHPIVLSDDDLDVKPDVNTLLPSALHSQQQLNIPLCYLMTIWMLNQTLTLSCHQHYIHNNS